MKIALVPLEHWEQLNLDLKEHVSVSADNSLRVYRGLAQATFEIVHGAAQFSSHKRNLGVVKGQTPYYEPLLSNFYKEAYGIQSISNVQLMDGANTAANVEAWVEGLKKDTNFVLFAEDHPVTGEIFSWEKLDELLNAKKIFSIRISHFRHFYDSTPLRPFSVQLCAMNPDLAIAKCGERFKVPPLVAPFMSWNVEAVLATVQKIHVAAQDKAQVEEFEKSLSDIGKPWFQSGASRLYDRVVMKFDDVSGEALLQALQAKLQMDPSQFYQTLDTTNLCRWNHYRTFNSWWEPKPTEQDLEGLLVIDSGWLVTKDFSKIVRKVCEEIRAQQSW